MQWLQQLKQKAKQLKQEVEVLIIAYSDPRTPAAAKILIAITVGYLLSPIDLIPDFIPVLGLLDDLLIVPLLIALSIKLIPDNVLADARVKVAAGVVVNRQKSRVAALVIILIWAILLYLGYRYFTQ